MSTFRPPFYDWAEPPIQWKTPDRSGPALPLASFWNNFQVPSVATRATYHPDKDMSAAVKKAFDAKIAQHNKVASENYSALRQGYLGNWVTRNNKY